ncbi:hypothetical protein [Halovivax gelatinilyticus]|uniref:hypothetical protein n=1 Tax=Halovivax gelatinilyticus TaxID=2961597 RepID=UPI0020CA4407|nr:hypothetical protein [Halovivax gelatinilyticus]
MRGRPTTRRRLVVVGATSALAGLAGCSTDGDDAVETDDGDDDDSSTDGDDDDSSTDGEPTSDTDANGRGDVGDPDDVDLASALEWERSYVVEIEFDGTGPGELTQTVHEGDTHVRLEFDHGQVVETYDVDGVTYEVLDGQCVVRSEADAVEEAPDVREPSGHPDASPSETTTIDGETVYVFEIELDDAAARWYLSAETGYPVKLEASTFTATFHSWGETSAIDPPEMACQEPP